MNIKTPMPREEMKRILLQKLVGYELAAAHKLERQPIALGEKDPELEHSLEDNQTNVGPDSMNS